MLGLTRYVDPGKKILPVSALFWHAHFYNGTKFDFSFPTSAANHHYYTPNLSFLLLNTSWIFSMWTREDFLHVGFHCFLFSNPCIGTCCAKVSLKAMFGFTIYSNVVLHLPMQCQVRPLWTCCTILKMHVVFQESKVTQSCEICVTPASMTIFPNSFWWLPQFSGNPHLVLVFARSHSKFWYHWELSESSLDYRQPSQY